jgi:hypothetical protein
VKWDESKFICKWPAGLLSPTSHVKPGAKREIIETEAFKEILKLRDP